MSLQEVAARLDEENPQRRREAAEVIERAARTDANQVTVLFPKLYRLLEDSNEAVVRHVARTLTHVAEIAPAELEPAIETLIDCLDTDDERIRGPIAQTLATLAKSVPDAIRPAAEPLRSLLDDDSSFARVPATRALARLALVHPDAVEPASTDLVRLLDAEYNNVVRGDAAKALAYLLADDPRTLSEAWSRLSELLDDDDPYVRTQVTGAVAYLAKHAPDVVVPAVDRVAARLDDDQVRGPASLALAHLAEAAPEEIAPKIGELRSLLDSDDQRIRGNAAFVLALVAKEDPARIAPATEDLISRLDDEYSFVRGNSVLALASLAQYDPALARDATRQLLELLEDVYFVRANTALALAHIAGAESDGDVGVAIQTYETFLGYNERRVTGVLVHVDADDREDVTPPPSTLLTLLRDYVASPPDELLDSLATRYLDEEYPDRADVVGDVLVEYLADIEDDPEVRLTVVETLARLADEKPEAVVSGASDLAVLLDAPEAALREQASLALGHIADDHPVAVVPHAKALETLLTADEPQAKIHASYALTRVAEADARAVAPMAEPLRNLLGSSQEQLRVNAALTLGHVAIVDIDRVLPAADDLLALLAEDSGREAAIGALSYAAEADPEAIAPGVDRVVNLLDGDSAAVRGNAAWTLVYLTETCPDTVADVVPTLVGLLQDEATQYPVLHVIEALADVQPSTARLAIPSVVDRLDSIDPVIRATACRVLGTLGATSVRDQVESLATDPESEVRDAAEVALESLDSTASETTN